MPPWSGPVRATKPREKNLLREHQERVAAQMRELSECYDLISYKVKIYEQHLAEGDADQLWNPERAD
jgi:hypothetical protein